jgi:hypothetical protein
VTGTGQVTDWAYSCTRLPVIPPSPQCLTNRSLAVLLCACLQDCKLLLVAESMAFSNLYTALSAAGVIAVQLDRDRKLPPAAAAHTPAAAADATVASIDPAAHAAWESAVASAVAAAGCVLATHEQLHHPYMQLQGFHKLIEYVPWDLKTTGPAAPAAAVGAVAGSSRAAVGAQFSGPGRHFVFRVQEPDLSALDAAQLAQQTAGGPAAAEAAEGQSAAAACKTPRGPQQEPAVGPHKASTPAAPAAGAATNASTAAPAATAAGASDVAEIPLLLNVSAGGLIKRRQSLYQV